MKRKIVGTSYRAVIPFLVILLMSYYLTAQISQGGTPYGIQQGLSRSNVPVVAMPTVNVDSLLVEDEMEPAETPPRFGYAHYVNMNINDTGYWVFEK